MSTDDIKHFLVIYDTASGEVEVKRFGSDYDAAQEAYSKAERANSGSDRYDIVLLSADSLRTIKKTHSSYFGSRDAHENLLLA